ncbi:Pkinase-domain-containing protein [Lentinula aff. detonsa]|uniref:non-specific serine/threonine protein kinase n=1 Tax=Lentinula aff. detonsa TaxID=2804958 RepID=A0AA38L5I5_9AGAR|nr:Pkinase-domain-containing protein [Lentinula aff. detonsa]
MAAVQDSSSDTAQTEGDGPEGSDKPPHEDISFKKNNNSASVTPIATMSTESHGVPLPPPEAGTYDKQPGYTVEVLKKLIESSSNGKPSTLTPAQIVAATNLTAASQSIPAVVTTAPSTISKPNANTLHIKQTSMSSNAGTTGTASPTSSPTVSEYDWNNSAPSTRTNSRTPSRAPSMSGGVAGSKLQMSKAGAAMTPVVSMTNGVQRSVSTNSAIANTHATPEPASPAIGSRPKPASVHSTDGEKHKFTLKDLLANGPKLARKSSQRSTGSRSSRKSDGGESDGGYKSGGGPKSAAGDSTTSLSQKYGVCQKVAIGKGATSVVRLAHKWDRSEERLYAIKEFRKRRKNETEKEYVKKLTAEFCISSTLHHTNIVETVDLVQDENQHWCEVMEFCPGGDLYAAIKKGGMSPSEVECCFKQILCGVSYLHSQGVAHRDIKPENLFFDTKGHLKIGDYGASTVYRLPWEATIHMSTGLCGSEPYIAPEQFLGKPYDARLVDIWACGVVYYCLHFSELPWRAAQKNDQLFASYAEACKSTQPSQSSCPPTINNLSPRACRTLLRRMLEPDPKLRAPIEEVMKHQWIQTIEVCHEVPEPKHVHVHARQLAQAQLRELRDE